MDDIIRIEKCCNCKRIYPLFNGCIDCKVGQKRKMIYDGEKYTENWYWCKGKYQQQIGVEGRPLNES